MGNNELNKGKQLIGTNQCYPCTIFVPVISVANRLLQACPHKIQLRVVLSK